MNPLLSNEELRAHLNTKQDAKIIAWLKARLARFERATAWFVVRTAIQQRRGLRGNSYGATALFRGILSITCGGLWGARSQTPAYRWPLVFQMCGLKMPSRYCLGLDIKYGSRCHLKGTQAGQNCRAYTLYIFQNLTKDP